MTLINAFDKIALESTQEENVLESTKIVNILEEILLTQKNILKLLRVAYEDNISGNDLGE